MPASYAHQCFGDEVLKRTSCQQLIRKHYDYYCLGLQGPDLLFYYHPTHRNPIIQKGNAMHQARALDLFEKERDETDERKIVYLLGLICHFTLDAACHPLINQWTKQKHWGHYAIERELDMALIKRHPRSDQRVAQMFVNSPDVGLCIGQVLGVEAIIIRKCISTFRLLNQLIYSYCVPLRYLAIAVIRLFHLGHFDEMFLRVHADVRMHKAIETLIDLANQNIKVAVSLQENYLEVLNGTADFNALFKRNYV